MTAFAAATSASALTRMSASRARPRRKKIFLKTRLVDKRLAE